MKAFTLTVLSSIIVSGCTSFSSPAELAGYHSAKQDGISKDEYASWMQSDGKAAIVGFLQKDDTALICLDKTVDEAASEIYGFLQDCVSDASARRPSRIKQRELNEFATTDASCGAGRFYSKNAPLINIDGVPNKYTQSCRKLKELYSSNK